MNRGHAQAINRAHLGEFTYEKLLKLPSNEENAKLNYEIPFHTNGATENGKLLGY